MIEREWQIMRNDFADLARARREFVSVLHQHTTGESDVGAAELVFGELGANAVRHARTFAVVNLRLCGQARLCVSEDSDDTLPDEIRPAALDAAGGRGLYIASVLSRELRFEQLNPGCAVSVVLPLEVNA